MCVTSALWFEGSVLLSAMVVIPNGTAQQRFVVKRLDAARRSFRETASARFANSRIARLRFGLTGSPGNLKVLRGMAALRQHGRAGATPV